MEPALVVVAAAIVDEGRLLVVSKLAAPHVYYLPGGKLEEGEEPTALVRELAEELGVVPTSLKPFAEVIEIAALERVPMQMTVFLTEIDGIPLARNEITELAWLDPDGMFPGELAPAVEKHVVPQLREEGLLAGVGIGSASG